MEIELCGYKVLIDEEDYEKVNILRWHVSNIEGHRIYFAHTNNGSHKFILHRYILNLKHGDGKTVDHISGNTLDNRKCNLRICSKAENVRNQKIRKDNKTGYKGVYYRKERGTYQAEIRVNNKGIYLGCYGSPQEAHAAYCEASKKYHGEFGRTE